MNAWRKAVPVQEPWRELVEQHVSLERRLSTQIEQVSAQTTQMSAQITQVSAQITQGFAQIVQRLETDLVGLSNRTHQLTQAMGDHSSVIAKLVADQNEIAETIRGLQQARFRQQRVSVQTDVADRTAESMATWVPSSNAALPPRVLTGTQGA